ncbi:hypothetical protein [Pedobacter agri]|uniref:hypothetical protein n=1 Tax=Pedobacter agri TaxID=454586 RepID=UPI002786B8A0|nr:hypothetical protein [Pedobacter agri]MDQ1141128.1 hypothetical protein [Pedobacter agri]
MIYIIDRFVEGHQHVLANVNTIKIIDRIYPGIDKNFLSEKSHNQLVKGYLVDLEDITYSSYLNKHSRIKTGIAQIIRVFTRAFRDTYFFCKFFKSISKQNDAVVFLTHIYPISLILFQIIKKFYPKVKTIVTIHGEIEYMFFGKGLYEKIIGKAYSLSFKIKSHKLYYLFLTKVSRDILLTSKKLKESEILAIILPTLSSIALERKENFLTEPFKIGHIGSAGRRKNADFIFSVAKEFEQEILDNKIQFSLIGSLESNIITKLNHLVKNYVNDQAGIHIERNIFNNEVNDIDYSIFFYNQHDFALRSSAAFFDAINFEKPIIALSNDFFLDVFREAGDIGYICRNINELIALIRSLIDDKETGKLLYKQHRSNLIKYKESLSIKLVAEDLKSQLDKLDFKIV